MSLMFKMKDEKQSIIKNHCYTELVYGRINKKLGADMSKEQIELFITDVLTMTDVSGYTRMGKNYYVTNAKENIRLTINSNTYRVITADKLKG